MNFNPFPEIKTDRLVLRKIEESDADIILFLRTDKTVTKFIERPENRKTKNKTDAIKFIREITEAFKNKESFSWGITLKNNSTIVGTICLWNFSADHKIAEIGYDLNPAFQKKGIMDEALKSVVNFGFSKLNLAKIEAFTHKENESSLKLLLKNNFQFIENRKDEDNPNNIIFEIEKPAINKA
ncbi:MAG: GNAT family N-acetyltransferase [Bacteroidetes bacterium HGW-Bacteroidetes-3]|jgi:ribosomal-protein-alanine N-acetyltransferase|nr:MAG: GNAT family N-acetyltransferase [Bacteroidetes bacterium HGW-Bacteroidetes-3]